MSNKQMDVQIMGQSYILGCPEGGEEGLMTAVRKVDAAMCKIRDAGSRRAVQREAGGTSHLGPPNLRCPRNGKQTGFQSN